MRFFPPSENIAFDVVFIGVVGIIQNGEKYFFYYGIDKGVRHLYIDVVKWEKI